MEAPKIATAIQSFPGMPGAAVKLLALIDDPAMRVSQIEEILRHDPGLTANVLRLANSAYFGIPSKIGSIRQAVILLGLKRLIQMVIAACVSAIMDKPVPGYDLPPGELWRHSIAVSVAAEGLVKELKIEAAEEIFTAVCCMMSASWFWANMSKMILKKLKMRFPRGSALRWRKTLHWASIMPMSGPEY